MRSGTILVNSAVSNYLLQAETAKDKGDYQLAEQLYRQALTLDPDNVEILHRLALLMLVAEQYAVAIPLLSKSVSLQPENAYLYYNLGLAYQGHQDIDAAIHYYKIAIQKMPDFDLAHNNLGVAYQHMGDFSSANKHLKKAFLLNPDCIEAYFNFVQSHKFGKEDKNIVDIISHRLKENQLSNKDQAKLHFSLGKIYDDLNQYEQAFLHYDKGNALKFQGFDSNQFEQYISNIIQVFDKNICKKLQSTFPDTQKRFVFIIGMPRSGSTLVEQIVANHPVVQSGGEIGFIGDIVDELPELLSSEMNYPECISSADKLLINAISLKVNAYINNLNYTYQVITDKSPVNFLHIGLILILFPNSLIIHTQRNPLDTCLSCYFQNFEKQHQYTYNLSTLGHFYRQYVRLMQHWKTLFPTQLFDIQYEELVEKQEENIKSLIKFIGLDWDEACLEFQNSSKHVTTASKWQIRQPIYRSSVGKAGHYQAYLGELIKALDDKSIN